MGNRPGIRRIHVPDYQGHRRGQRPLYGSHRRPNPKQVGSVSPVFALGCCARWSPRLLALSRARTWGERQVDFCLRLLLFIYVGLHRHQCPVLCAPGCDFAPCRRAYQGHPVPLYLCITGDAHRRCDYETSRSGSW